MILVVNLCKEDLHYFEFVRPIENLLEDEFVTKKYFDVNKLDLQMADKVIICGTSLRDDEYLDKLDKFSWIKDFKKPILGICAGFQILGLIYGCKVRQETEIGYYEEKITKDFLGVKGKIEVYHLHNNYLEINEDYFDVFSEGEIAQAAVLKARHHYGVLFHPEVRSKEIILNFVNME